MSADPKRPDEPEAEGYAPKVDRRTALTWVLIAGGGAIALAGAGIFALQNPHGLHPAKASGYGTDPKLNPPAKAPWPRILSADELTTAAALGDFILPASGSAPSASALGVPDFIDEWVSAPYPDQLKDRPIIVNGLRALAPKVLRGDAGQRKAALAALPVSTDAATRAFFKRFRALAVGAYYTTEAGFKDIGYIGNVARASDPGPSEAVKAVVEARLKDLGL